MQRAKNEKNRRHRFRENFTTNFFLYGGNPKTWANIQEIVDFGGVAYTSQPCTYKRVIQVKATGFEYTTPDSSGKMELTQRKNILVKAQVLQYKLPRRTGMSVLPVFPGNSPVFYLKIFARKTFLQKFLYFIYLFLINSH